MSNLLSDHTELNGSNKQSFPRICPRCKSDQLEVSPVEADYAELACYACGRHIRWIGRSSAIDRAQAYTLRSGRFRGTSLGEVPARYLLWLERSESVSHRMRKRAGLVLLAIRENGGSVRGPRSTSAIRESTSRDALDHNDDSVHGTHGKAPGVSSNTLAISSPCFRPSNAVDDSAGLTGVHADRSTDVVMRGEPIICSTPSTILASSMEGVVK
jgi:hypothetical protein